MNKLTRSWIHLPAWAVMGTALAGLALPALASPMPAGTLTEPWPNRAKSSTGLCGCRGKKA